MINQGGILNSARSDQKIHERYLPFMYQLIEIKQSQGKNAENEIAFVKEMEQEVSRLKDVQRLYLASRIEAIKGNNSGSCKRDDCAFIYKIIKRFKKICIYDKLKEKDH